MVCHGVRVAAGHLLYIAPVSKVNRSYASCVGGC